MFPNEPDVLDVEQCCHLLQCGKNRLYELIRENEIRAVKPGKKFIIPKEEVVGYIKRQINSSLMN